MQCIISAIGNHSNSQMPFVLNILTLVNSNIELQASSALSHILNSSPLQVIQNANANVQKESQRLPPILKQ